MSESLFVEEAARVAATEPRLPGEAEADALLAEARASIYHWPQDFSGFSCGLSVVRSGLPEMSGRFTAPCSRKLQLEGDFGEDPRWLRFQLEELVSHREAPEKSKMANHTGATLGDLDPIYGQQVYLAGDSMRSFHRIKDRRLTQIGRAYRGQDLLITIDAHHEIINRFAAQAYTAFYRSQEDGALKKVETYLDLYLEVQGIHLPHLRRLVTATSRGVEPVELRFFDHGMLPDNP